jgi:hypothetical protein
VTIKDTKTDVHQNLMTMGNGKVCNVSTFAIYAEFLILYQEDTLDEKRVADPTTP